jgi:hypothetical protein
MFVAVDKCESEGRLENFVTAGKVIRGGMGKARGAMPFDDTDVYQTIFAIFRSPLMFGGDFYRGKLQNKLPGKSLNAELPGIFIELPVSFTHFTRYLFAKTPLLLQHNNSIMINTK